MSGTAYLISCSDHYHHRMFLWDSCLKSLGYQTKYITSDFDHYAKETFTCDVEGCVQLPVRPYKKNFSVDRILSHRMFAKAVNTYAQAAPPDVIVALLPPNFLAKYLADFKKAHPKTFLIFDIFDMWPETFPSGRLKMILSSIFSLWASLRDRSLPAADLVTTECDLFRDLLKLNRNSSTVYLCAPNSPATALPVLAADRLELCYLGSINNIISIPDICDLIRSLVKVKPVTLHIIGKGERQQELIDGATTAGAEVNFYGAVYDPVQKQKIMDQCHFGLNIMKSSVCIGLSMKTVDYFRHNLPIINTIPADTERFIHEEGVGVQFGAACADEILKLTPEDYLQMRKCVETVFNLYFRRDNVEAELRELLTNLLE